jgi:hypothetical protein
MSNINEQLYNLYASKWDDISETLLEIHDGDHAPEPTNPLLLYIDKEEEWENADLRVMVFGQETKDWEKRPDKSIAHLRNVYHHFFNECQGKNSPFWNGIVRFRAMLGAKYPNKRIHYVWNNIIKIGKETDAGPPPANIYAAEREWFHVIPDEVKILRPNVLLFFSGPNYDDAIRDNFGEVAYAAVPPYAEKQLAKITISDIDFAFRTYHPGYLMRNNINDYLHTIVKEVTL